MDGKLNAIRKQWRWSKLALPVFILLVFWGIGVWGFIASGFVQPLIMFGYIGLALGIGLGLYAVLPKRDKPSGRRLTLFLIGLFMLGFAIFMGQENVQLEGALFGLLTGVIQMGVIHYLIAKIAGPVIFGRMWCGWACWTVMVLDLLPFTRSPGRLAGKWGWLRYVHFLLSVAVVLALVYGFNFSDGAAGRTAVVWFIVGNGLYYAFGIILAYALQDNRAFCKYVCPITVPLKLTSRFSFIKVQGAQERCTGCRVCDTYCPMDIEIGDYVQAGQSVLSTECILCQTCVTVCPHDALKVGAGFEMGGKERLRIRP